MTCACSNLPKFLDNAGNTGSAVTVKIGSMLLPGTEVDGKIVSRSVLWFSLTGMVSSQSEYPEVAYLLLQWLGSARIYAWMTANPGGYFDPFSLNDFADPLERETYHAYHMDVVRATVARTVPSINYPAAQAMADTADAWAKITRRTGEEKTIEAIKANKAAWPTVLDPA